MDSRRKFDIVERRWPFSWLPRPIFWASGWFWGLLMIFPRWLTGYSTVKHALEQARDHEANLKEDLRIVNEANSQEVYYLRNEVKELTRRLAKTESEKDDALTRLSQLVSVKLRDNNPNIVDLNDQFRPTKLAEMFSELYDNEWTGAYTVMEKTFQGPQIVSFLLDIVMEAYNFSRCNIEQNWEYVQKWYLDERFPWYQQTRKALKDGRKIIVQNLSPEIEKEFMNYIKSICGDETLSGLLPAKAMEKYMGLSIKLCLLMNASDPPVVIDCPDWNTLTIRRKEDTAKLAKKPEETPEENNKNDQTDTDADKNDTDVPKVIEDTSEPKSQRSKFGKDQFKEYTKRGRFLKFYVWPVMFLHKDGAMLGKGVAQGTVEEYKDESDRVWKWWK